jgi:hypothetical protein
MMSLDTLKTFSGGPRECNQTFKAVNQAMTNSGRRYQGKPFLRLLECYVLWTIGELSETESKTLHEMTPKLRSIYDVQGDWQDIVAAVVELPLNMPELIRGVWARNVEIAQKSGAILSPQEFAEMFVDKNLV